MSGFFNLICVILLYITCKLGIKEKASLGLTAD